ncbi:DUF1553 domain-containing protein [Rhodocytophaga aerolata]|uniref:DUF1553 domain-containing protein n=1 Tax=Rhodocytophaga aerolata TaxID=455078 RepID=A0ABT8RIJ1_9BACT|nr:DUF1553 domain-containing protein [Rhodocytophaga aerolata]MDO1451179.1 DUF1553 domain-containing protein [Rhodocytophaga aerolata]
MARHSTWFIVLVFAVLLSYGCQQVTLPEEIAQAANKVPDKVDFNLHIKPILSDRCFACHGPDKNTREADLRLDIAEGAFAALSSGNGKAVVPGSLHKSELVRRILSEDPEEQMPPASSNMVLTPEEKATLIKWIDQGAEYKPHWAFIAPEKPEVPEVKNKTWNVHNPIDNFVLATLESKGLKQSPEADKERLLRRVTMDLTGLPPTIAEIDAFLNDKSPQAYEKVVDRLLKTDAYAERMAMEWLDVARYADSHGMHADGWRMMWPWRDWVIKAFKNNMPYDQFSTWQIAGDLLPNATKEQILATAFNRNHPMTAEGGVIDEEFRLKYVFDRTNTIGTAYLGLTVECAQCHDHKFDPITQKDYYSLSAFFNNVKELGMTGDDGNYGPMLLLPDEKTEKEIAQLDKQIADKEKELKLSSENTDAIVQFISTAIPKEAAAKPVVYLPFEKQKAVLKKDKYNVTKQELHFDGTPSYYSPGTPELVEGKVGKALLFNDEFDEVFLNEKGNYELHESFSVGMWINTSKKEKDKTQTLIGNTGNKNNFWRGWEFYLDSTNHLAARLIHSLPHNYLHVRSTQEISLNTWTHVAFSYDGSGKASGIRLYINGEKDNTATPYDRLYKTIKTIDDVKHLSQIRPLKIGRSYRAFTGEFGIYKGMMDEIYLYNRALTSLEVARLANPAIQPDNHLQQEFSISQNPRYQTIAQELASLREAKVKLMNRVPEIMVMEEMSKPRPAFVLNRGQYDAPKEKVQPATPESVLSFPDNLPKNRLGLSKWLFDARNPLTARVTVNRYWQLFFGKGLVKTAHDFGNQGNLPTHPQLLDWLAVSFRESGWDVKKLMKLIVMSATYRQSSKANKETLAIDAENLYLARGPQYRLPAEMIRDNALAASGLLVSWVGGESVKPYQPEGLWTEKNNFSHMLFDYVPSKGDSLYRRSMYSFIRRTSPHPAMIAFDATARDVCMVKREITNTPLQALVLLNDPQFVEAARVLAVRVQKEAGAELEKQLELAFRLTTGRKPRHQEIDLLKELYQSQYTRFSKNSKQAEELLQVGEYKQESGMNKTKTAALAMVASTLINHDESYMKR